MTDRTIDPALKMNPVGKDHKFGKFIHPLPGDLLSLLNIFHHFKGFRLLAEGICGMAGTTEVDVRDRCGAVFFWIAMAEETVQIGCLLMADMVKENGLIDGNPGKNWKDGEKGSLCLDGESVIGDDRQEKNNDHTYPHSQSLFHSNADSKGVEDPIQWSH